ncbi:MAG: NAD(P)-dependent oxidoreductase [Chitinophagales bacterium]|nr:NAD(P)-dependent oxidoreductase [Chitinophagales bacterium]
MKIFITGANGFIGSYLAYFFLKKGEHVIASSRHFHESSRNLLKEARLVELDILNSAQLQNIEYDADIIIHTATANDIISKNSLRGIELSAIGTKNILDFAVKNHIGKCLVFSTFQVYGTELTGAISESTALKYQNDYGLNHLFAEMYAEMYSRLGKIKCVSVRPANVYGPIITKAFNRWSLVPGCFCKEAFELGAITIKSSGKQMRNFVNLENLSRAIDYIIHNFPDEYENYNLASSKGNTMLEVAEIVKQVYENEFQKPLQVNIEGTEPMSTNFFTVSMEKLKRIGFVEDNTFSLQSEIKQIFEYLKSQK